MKKQILLALLLLNALALSGCGGSSSSGGGDSASAGATSSVPVADLVGVYQGTLSLTATVAGVSQTETANITITVTEDQRVVFTTDGEEDDVDVPLNADGSFTGSLSIVDDECSGSAALDGRVDGAQASGTLSGTASCQLDGTQVDGELSGDFSAIK